MAELPSCTARNGFSCATASHWHGLGFGAMAWCEISPIPPSVEEGFQFSPKRSLSVSSSNSLLPRPHNCHCPLAVVMEAELAPTVEEPYDSLLYAPGVMGCTADLPRPLPRIGTHLAPGKIEPGPLFLSTRYYSHLPPHGAQSPLAVATFLFLFQGLGSPPIAPFVPPFHAVHGGRR